MSKRGGSGVPKSTSQWLLQYIEQLSHSFSGDLQSQILCVVSNTSHSTIKVVLYGERFSVTMHRHTVH